MKIFQQKNSPNWYVRLFSGGRDKWVSLRTSKKSEAQARAARIAYTAYPKLLKMSVEKPPLEIALLSREYEHTPEWEKLKPSTAEMNMLTLSKFCEWCKSRRIALTSKLSASVANSYMDGMEVGPKTHNNTKITLSAIWRAIGEENIWQEVKSRPLKTNPMRGFTEKEITAIFERVAFDPFWRPACYLALFTGLRLTDIVHLRRSQIHKNHSYLELRPSKTERTGRAVYIPIHPTLKKELQTVHGKSDHLFPEAVRNYDNSRHMIIKQFSRILDNLDIDNTDSGRAGFHSWRVTFASRARENGISAETIRAVLGHTTKAMTAHYTDTPEALSLDSMPDVKIS